MSGFNNGDDDLELTGAELAAEEGFKIGDRVRVTMGRDELHNQEGIIIDARTEISYPYYSLRVKFKDIESWLLPNYLRVVISQEEVAEQVSGIRASLKKGEIKGWTEEEYQAVAESLYKAGVRYKEEDND